MCILGRSNEYPSNVIDWLVFVGANVLVMVPMPRATSSAQCQVMRVAVILFFYRFEENITLTALQRYRLRKALWAMLLNLERCSSLYVVTKNSCN